MAENFHPMEACGTLGLMNNTENNTEELNEALIRSKRIAEAIGQWIYTAREEPEDPEDRLTSKELAELAGVSETTLRNLERGVGSTTLLTAFTVLAIINPEKLKDLERVAKPDPKRQRYELRHPKDTGGAKPASAKKGA